MERHSSSPHPRRRSILHSSAHASSHELRPDDSVAKAVHGSRHRRVILCALRSEEELPIDDTRAMDEVGEQNDSTAAVGLQR
jgi:hypothetical protein